MKNKKNQKSNKSVVWTKSRPWLIVHGEIISRKGDTVTLRDARLAVYYDASCRGVLGLASHGPSDASRISRACEEVTLAGVEGVAAATPEATAKWEAEPWE